MSKFKIEKKKGWKSECVKYIKNDLVFYSIVHPNPSIYPWWVVYLSYQRLIKKRGGKGKIASLYSLHSYSASGVSMRLCKNQWRKFKVRWTFKLQLFMSNQHLFVSTVGWLWMDPVCEFSLLYDLKTTINIVSVYLVCNDWIFFRRMAMMRLARRTRVVLSI